MSKLKLEIESEPESIAKLKRQTLTLEIEKAALKKENTKPERLQSVSKEIADINEQLKKLEAQWHLEKESVGKINEIKEILDQKRFAAAQAEKQADFAKAAEIRHGEIPKLEAELNELLGREQTSHSLLRETITENDIAEIIARWTGIPATKLTETESHKLTQLEHKLHESLIGQNKAITTVANAIRRNKTGLGEPNRPIGSFLFLGPTGVGKTELAKTLAEELFDSREALIRFDMSEFMESHSTAKLIGAPPGYVGHDEGGQLTEKIRRRPYSVLLFDEVEKAHRDVFNVFLQILDDGHVTDSKGRKINFKNTIIIFTSNLLADLFQSEKLPDEKSIREGLMQFFRPEFLNRLDDIIPFHQLQKEHVSEILKLQIKQLQTRLKTNQDLEITLDENAVEHLLKIGFDPAFGARPLKRAIEKELLNPLALKLLEKTGNMKQIKIGFEDDQITLN